MRSSSILVAAGLAATATANIQIQTAPNQQAGSPVRRDLASCNSVATALLPKITDGAPTVPADVANYLAFSASVTDACADPQITGSVGSAYSTYAASLTSWRDAHMSDFRAVWQACSDVQGVATVLPVGSGQCSSLVAQITSAGPVGGNGIGGGNGNGGDRSGNAGPRETGAVMAAAAMAGFVVAALQ
ncbi:hypothetical protein CkaCkLH20_08599 [Colletotrichum karsti]|uniref:Infection structure specific protein n=1 Tax=Colletotrichum karsti TaxID=1095194 RepID=A0A9P6I898_9PEZI|nr:uncharacterized protein CkaCkLH20_08599 [Colletotrichum karsti]KAF9873865.1 hypothetical protein CkaCkLH20_08599 [Colletotrichum karsti]